MKRLGPIIVSLGVVSLLNDAASEMIVPLLPAFMATLPGGGAFAIGLMEGLAETVAAFLKLGSGWIADRTGRRGALILAGYSLAAVARSLIGLAGSVPWVVAMRVVDRIGKGLRASPRDAMISTAAAKEDRGLAFGFHRAMDHAGAFIGPLVAMGLISLAGLQVRSVILLAVVPGLLALVPLVHAVRRAGAVARAAGGGAAPAGRPAAGGGGLGRGFYFYIAVCFVFTLGNSSDLFLLLRATQAGVSATLLPLLWVVLHASKILFSVPAGLLSDRIGRKKPILAGWGVYAVTYLLVPRAEGLAQFLLLFAFYGLFFAFTEGVEKAFVSDLVPEEKRGTAFGAYNFAAAAGALPSSLAMGALYQWAGPAVAFGAGAALAMVAAAGLLFVREPARPARTT